MAVDIYVGPASRYLVGDWKTLGQQAAEAQGIGYQLVGAGVRTRPGLLGKFRFDREYRQWREALAEAKRRAGDSTPLWNDDEAQAYVTDRPGFEGLAGILIGASHLEFPEMPPATGPATPDGLETDEAYVRAVNESVLVAVLAQTTVYVPGEFPYLELPFINGDPMGFHSLAWLRHGLDRVCALSNIPREEYESWVLDQPETECSWEEATAYGFGCLFRMAAESESRNLPLIWDW